MNDPFQTLGVDARFDLDLTQIEQRHRDVSRALHPDRYTGAPAAERRLSLARAIDVNEAYRVLRDPIRRAEALIRRAGVHVGETGEPRPTPALLMDMMEAREDLAEARRARDFARIAKLAENMRERGRNIERHLGSAFDSASGDPQKIAGVLPVLGELRYVRRFLDEVNAIEEELAP